MIFVLGYELELAHEAQLAQDISYKNKHLKIKCYKQIYVGYLLTFKEPNGKAEIKLSILCAKL